MILYTAFSQDEQYIAGPFTDRAVADIALKILQLVIDEDAELLTTKADRYADEIKAGLKPWLVSIELRDGRITGPPQIELTWPPREEGVILENDCQKRYFVWALTQNEAIRKLPNLKKVECLDQDGGVEDESR